MMLRFLASVGIIIAFTSCDSDNKGNLTNKVQNLELTYISWACDCANWATSEDIAKYLDDQDSLAMASIFIEPADKSLILPDTLAYPSDILAFTGSFYKKKGLPEGYNSIEFPDKARVFRYTGYKVLKSNYRHTRGLK